METKSPEQIAAEEKLRTDTEACVEQMLFFRRLNDAANFRFYKQFVGYREQQFFPDGVTKRSNLFFPYPQSNVETITSRVDDALFPDGDWFECNGEGMADQPAAEKMGTVLKYKLERADAIGTGFQPVIKNACIYRLAGLKVDWDHGYDIVDYKEPVFPLAPVTQPIVDPQTGQPQTDANGQPVMQMVVDPQTGQPQMTPDQNQPPIGFRPAQKPVKRNRPKFIPIDPFDLLVDPNGIYIGHIVERSLGEMIREAEGFKAQTGEDLYFPEALDEIKNHLVTQKEPLNVIIRFAEVWNRIDGSVVQLTCKDQDGLSWKDARLALRALNSSSFNRQMYGGKTVVLYAGKNQFAHKQIPILTTSYIKIPNEIYGISAVETIAELNEHLSKQVGILEDNWNMGVNARYGINTDADVDHDSLNNANVPGGKVFGSGDPKTWMFPLPILKPEQGDYQMIELTRGMCEMGSGVSDFYSKGVGAPSDNGTATGIASIINESNFRFKQFIRNIGRDILRPALKMTASMIQQFVTNEEEMLITDEQAGIPKIEMLIPEQIIGQFDFVVNDANYASNKTVRQRNLMALANIAKESGYLKEGAGLRRLFKEFQIPGWQELVMTDQEYAANQQAQQQQMLQMQYLELQKELILIEAKAKAACMCKDEKGGGKPALGSSSKDSKPRGSNDGRGGGRKPSTQMEGSIPGAGTTSESRLSAQGVGANSLGLGQMGEIGNG
jgi:hypothetical protein